MLNTIIEHKESIISIVTGVVTIAAAVSAITPNESDNKFVDSILKIFNAIGLNIGNAKNK